MTRIALGRADPGSTEDLLIVAGMTTGAVAGIFLTRMIGRVVTSLTEKVWGEDA